MHLRPWKGPFQSEMNREPRQSLIFDLVPTAALSGVFPRRTQRCGSKALTSSAEFGEAVGDFGAVPVEQVNVVVRGAVLANIADEAGLAVYALVAHEAGEEFAGGANEGPAIVFLFFAGRLADHGDAVVYAIDDRVLVGHKPGHGESWGRAGGGLLSGGGGLGRNEVFEVRHRGDVVADVIALLGLLDADLGDGFGAEHAGHGFGVERRTRGLALLVVGVPGAKKGVDKAGHLLHEKLVADVEGGEEREARLNLQAIGCRCRFA